MEVKWIHQHGSYKRHLDDISDLFKALEIWANTTSKIPSKDILIMYITETIRDMGMNQTFRLTNVKYVDTHIKIAMELIDNMDVVRAEITHELDWVGNSTYSFLELDDIEVVETVTEDHRVYTTAAEDFETRIVHGKKRISDFAYDKQVKKDELQTRLDNKDISPLDLTNGFLNMWMDYYRLELTPEGLLHNKIMNREDFKRSKKWQS